LYKWDTLRNTLTDRILMTFTPAAEAYSPTLIGPDGMVFALAMGTLNAIACEGATTTSSMTGTTTTKPATGTLRARLSGGAVLLLGLVLTLVV
jgi:hypothetical protein